MDVGFHLRKHRVYVPAISPKVALARGTPPTSLGMVFLGRELRQLMFAGQGVSLPPVPPIYQRYLIYELVDGAKVIHAGGFRESARINYPVIPREEYAWGIRLFAAFAELQHLRKEGWGFAVDIRTPAITVHEMSDFLWAAIPMIQSMEKQPQFKVTILFTGKIQVTRGTEDLDGQRVGDSSGTIGSVQDGEFYPATEAENMVGALVYKRPSGEWVAYYDGLQAVEEPKEGLSGWYLLGTNVQGTLQTIAPITPCPIPLGVHIQPKYITCLDSTFITAADMDIYNLIVQNIEIAQAGMEAL